MISSVVIHNFTPAQLESLKSGLHGVIGVSSITWATEKGLSAPLDWRQTIIATLV